MRILLAHNSQYYPAYGGGDKSNRLLMQALAARGHEIRVAARTREFGPQATNDMVRQLERRGFQPATAAGVVELNLEGVSIGILTNHSRLRDYFASQIETFDPDIILTSTDDPAHLFLEVALRATRSRVVHLVRATVALPFGPESALPMTRKTEVLRNVSGIVAVSEYVARYVRQWGGLDATHVPISLLAPEGPALLGGFENPLVLMVNPCAVKGISIFLALAETAPNVKFGAVPSWGTSESDLGALRRLPNISIIPPVDDFDEILKRTRVALVPSLWAEARSRVILEAMSCGIPVIASNVGGLAEAKLGVDYLLPVTPVTKYRPTVDELMIPLAEIPSQDISLWRSALERLTSDRDHYNSLSRQSREAALEYARTLNVSPFEAFLHDVARSPRRAGSFRQSNNGANVTERKHLLGLRLRRVGDNSRKAHE